jgi:DNA-binding response OmpR family regulator
VVVGHGPDLERDEGAASLLRGLGSSVRCLDLWDDPVTVVPADDEAIRAIVVEAMDRPDLAAAALRALRREPELGGVGAIVAVTLAQVSRLDPSLGFDDFVLVPYVPAELYARVRAVEWRRSEFVSEERIKLGAIVIDRSGHEVLLRGRSVRFTAREFALLAYLCERRGRVVSRQEALERVWGELYEGGLRTVDIHVRRLRSKLGSALPLETLRGSGYKIAPPDETERDNGEVDDAATDLGSEAPAEEDA